MRLRYLILGLAFVPALSFAQVQAPTYRGSNGVQIHEAQGTFCLNPDGSACSGSPSGGGGDASSANQSLQLTQEQLTAARLGDTASPATGSVNQRLGIIVSSITTPGSTAPAYAQQVGGVGPAGNLRALSTDTRGALVPGQAIVATSRTTMTASTATSISAASTGRIGLSIFAEAALTANVYLCTTQTTGCSATSYDFLVPSGASAGTIYTSLFAPNTAVYAFTTGTPVLVVNSWTAQ